MKAKWLLIGAFGAVQGMTAARAQEVIPRDPECPTVVHAIADNAPDVSDMTTDPAGLYYTATVPGGPDPDGTPPGVTPVIRLLFWLVPIGLNRPRAYVEPRNFHGRNIATNDASPLYVAEERRLTIIDKTGQADPRFVRTRSYDESGGCPYIVDLAPAADGTLYWIQSSIVCSDFSRGDIVALDPGASEGRLVFRDGQPKQSLQVQGNFLYWSAPQSNGQVGIFRAPRAGGGAVLLSPARANRIAVDSAGRVFYSDANPPLPDPGRTFRIDGPGQVTPILNFGLTTITTDGAYLYGVDYRPSASDPTVGNVVRFKPNGHGVVYYGKSETFLTPALDERNIYYGDPTGTRILVACK